ncbi:aminoglycoside phosphotransferase family protein [Tenggerimyces flavus]|uniref:Phosphotransferase n=1 Tax=Tenggerimyces flavus TaxID=1708749 RepID=A0ABV7YG48_9ACTN|nr:phosphotransferase [Tenggerimyces flavus]MBM7784321.1 hypothetical protein [Tenggerimyces flavus]
MSPSAATIERLLGVPVVSVERVAPWEVARATLADGRTVIVKWGRAEGVDRAEPERFLAERSALEFVADLGLTPKLLAAGDGLLVMEDLGPRPSLRELLLDGDDTALVDFARTLGRLHAATVGRAEEYYAGLGAWADPSADRGAFLALWQDGVDHLADFGVPMSTAAAHELAAVIEEILEPGPFLALSNGDVGLNNYLVLGPGDGRLIDFEAAGFRSVLAEMTDIFTPGPMWVTLDDPAPLEAAYRAEFDVVDDRTFGRAVAGGVFVWAARRFATLPKIDARPAGELSRPHRIATLEAAAATAERFGCLPALTGWTLAGAAMLRKRWPDADIDLAALPPYTTRT